MGSFAIPPDPSGPFARQKPGLRSGRPCATNSSHQHLVRLRPCGPPHGTGSHAGNSSGADCRPGLLCAGMDEWTDPFLRFATLPCEYPQGGISRAPCTRLQRKEDSPHPAGSLTSAGGRERAQTNPVTVALNCGRNRVLIRRTGLTGRNAHLSMKDGGCAWDGSHGTPAYRSQRHLHAAFQNEEDRSCARTPSDFSCFLLD